MKDSIATLKEITDVLLAPEMDYSAVRNACTSLSTFYNTLSGFDYTTQENQAHIHTSSGLAVGPMSAAFCIIDMLRTRNFLQGIKEAIETRLKTNSGKPVTVFYAGTGPFATLLTPLTTVFEPDQLQLVLLEINPISIEYLYKVINKLALEPYIIDIIEADATMYIIPDKHQPDIIVSETMKPGLDKEPWISIAAHLLPQCRYDPIVIPALVKVEAALIGSKGDIGFEVLPLKVLMEFSAATAMAAHRDKNSLPIFSDGVIVSIDELPAICRRLVLSTSIEVFNRHSLHFNECGLTIPFYIMDIINLKKIPASLLFRYELGSNPGFRVSEL